jgi:elongation factor 2
MADKESSLDKIKRLIAEQKNIRNVATSAHIHHGKTAFTDNLLAAAGMMANKNAGDLEEGMATWQHSDEQERLMTVDAANVSMVHNYQGEEYLVNLIDTPGHVDFGGNVTRAMRAIDGTFVLVCAVEGIMPQTETVLRQALKERVKPVLFINKVDRLINELQVTPEQMQERFAKIIERFNHLIDQIAEKEFAPKFKVNVADGSVAFGSARENWALSIPFMMKKKITFKDIYRLYDGSMSQDVRDKWVWENAPLYEVILDMAVKHLPNPIEAQSYRIPKIWKGDLESEFGKSLMKCDKKGEVAFVITRIVIDPRSGKEISAGRLYSGTIRNGMDVYANNAKQPGKIQQVLVYNGIKPEQMDAIPAGNVLAVSGLNLDVGETITENEQTSFEEIRHIFQPVITKSIEVKKTADLPKLIEILRKVSKEDPSIKVSINEETGESLISGMGELHLEIIENRIKTEKGLDVKTSNPIVVYRESVGKSAGQAFEGRSPNKHNSFVIKVEPLGEELAKLIDNGDLPEGRMKKKNEAVVSTLSKIGWGSDEIRNVKDIYKGSMFFDETRGEVHIGEVIEMVLDAFEMVMDQGPLAREPCMRMKVTLEDIKLHEDAIHRGPAQVYPAVREAITEAMRGANATLLEPLQIHVIEVPENFMGAATKLVGGKRGQLLDMTQEMGQAQLKAKIPVAEMIGWSSDLRSATEGRGTSSLLDQQFEKIPASLQEDVIRKIRDRKGLAENQ